MAIAVVVGGASGIGRACCRILAARGWRVVVADLDEREANRRTAAQIGAAAYVLDVTDEASVESAAARIEQDIGPVHRLVNSWGPRGVRVNAVSPGFMRSPAFQAKLDPGERNAGVLEGATALRRLMEPEDSANAVAFLLSHEAAGITEINLPVDGGWLWMQSWASYPGIRGDWP